MPLQGMYPIRPVACIVYVLFTTYQIYLTQKKNHKDRSGFGSKLLQTLLLENFILLSIYSTSAVISGRQNIQRPKGLAVPSSYLKLCPGCLHNAHSLQHCADAFIAPMDLYCIPYRRSESEIFGTISSPHIFGIL